MSNPLIFFYNDANILGGHELLTAQIINTLVDQLGFEVHFAYHCEELTAHLSGRVATSRLPFHSKTPKLIHQAQNDIGRIRRLIQQLQPDIGVISQGYIESGVRAVLAAQATGIPFGSYIPFGSTNKELNNKFARSRDWLAKPVYKLNRFYLTISRHQAELLERLVGDRPVHVINNPVANVPVTPAAPTSLMSTDREDTLDIAVIGRLLFKQKNQGLLPKVAQLCQQREFPVHFHIVGEGPDREELLQLINNTGTNCSFTLHGWLDKQALSELLIHTVDVVMIPSHYEGLPLVFIESLFQGKPVLISDMPFVADYPLDSAYIFDGNCAESAYRAIRNIRERDHIPEVEALQDHLQQTNSYERFVDDVESAFGKLLLMANSAS